MTSFKIGTSRVPQLCKNSSIEITVENRCERIPTFTGGLLMTLGTIKNFLEMTRRDLWSKTWNKKQAAKHKSLKFFISHWCLQNKMLLTLLVFVAKAILSPQFFFSLSAFLMIISSDSHDCYSNFPMKDRNRHLCGMVSFILTWMESK